MVNPMEKQPLNTKRKRLRFLIYTTYFRFRTEERRWSGVKVSKRMGSGPIMTLL